MGKGEKGGRDFQGGQPRDGKIMEVKAERMLGSSVSSIWMKTRVLSLEGHW